MLIACRDSAIQDQAANYLGADLFSLYTAQEMSQKPAIHVAVKKKISILSCQNFLIIDSEIN